MSKIRIAGAAGLQSFVGQSLGATEWQTMSYERIATFADASGDHQWIHVDKERIAKESPFGRPLAHGYLSLALVGGLFFELVELEGFKLVINYGANKLRFPAPLREGDRYRLSMRLAELKDVGGGWLEATLQGALEVEGSAKPACAVEVLYRFST